MAGGSSRGQYNLTLARDGHHLAAHAVLDARRAATLDEDSMYERTGSDREVGTVGRGPEVRIGGTLLRLIPE
jgi:hypothetical protein